jgi:cytochrome c oxidase subunit I+III
MKRERTTVDVSALPTYAFGHKAVMWWGTLGFIVIEGFTLALCAASYMYLRRNFDAWPPPRTALPDLLVPTVNVLLMLACIVPQTIADNAAKRFDLPATRRWLIVASVVGLAVLVLRGFEFGALNTRWDSHAYGSVSWLLLGLHTTLLLLDVFDTVVLAVLFLFGPIAPKHLAAVGDNALYWNFMSIGWVPVYLLLFWSPRLPG